MPQPPDIFIQNQNEQPWIVIDLRRSGCGIDRVAVRLPKSLHLSRIPSVMDAAIHLFDLAMEPETRTLARGLRRAIREPSNHVNRRSSICANRSRWVTGEEFSLRYSCRCRCVHGRRNSFCVQSNKRPLRSAQDHKGYAAACEVLLIAHVLVGGQKHVEPGPFCFGQQVAVGQRIPSSFFGLRNGVTRNEPGDATRGYGVKKNAHRRRFLRRGPGPGWDRDCERQTQEPR